MSDISPDFHRWLDKYDLSAGEAVRRLIMLFNEDRGIRKRVQQMEDAYADGGNGKAQ